MRGRLTHLVLVVCLAACGVARAQAWGPALGGHYRPGRAAAVVVQGTGRIDAGGGVPTVVTAAAPGSVVPLLAARPLAGDGWRPLGEDERLVVGAALPTGVAAAVFPDATIIHVHEAPTDVVPAAAWASVDALVTAAPPEPPRVAALLAACVTLVVTEPPPPGPWPWTAAGAGWVLRPPAAVVPLVAPAVYDALDRGPVGMPPATRRAVVLAAALAGVALTAAGLVRGRRGAAAVLAVAVAATAGAVAWSRTVRPVDHVRATVLVSDGPLARRDQWTLAAAPKPVPLDADGLPVFRTPDAAAGELWVDGAEVRYRALLTPSRPVATVTTTVISHRTDAGPSSAALGALRLLAGPYLRPGDQLTAVPGVTGDAGDIGTLLIERRPQ